MSQENKEGYMSPSVAEQDKKILEEASAEPPKDVTQVQTLQQMAVSQGQTMPKEMTPEQLDAQLLLDHMMGLKAVVPAFAKLGKNGMIRLWTAMMQLPQEGLDVKLNGDFEKQIFLAAQKVQYAKHAIIFRKMKREADVEKKAIAETEEKRLKEIKLSDNVSVENKTEEVIKI